MVPCPVCTLRRGPADCRCLEGTLVPPVFDERTVFGRLRRPEPEIAWCSTTIDVIEAYHQFAGTSSTALAPRFSERGGLANLLESMGPGWRSSGYALASDELARQLGKRWCRHSKYLSCRPSQPKWPWHQGDGANSRREPCLPARSRRIDHTDGETLWACYMRPVPVRATSKQPLARASSWPFSDFGERQLLLRGKVGNGSKPSPLFASSNDRSRCRPAARLARPKDRSWPTGVIGSGGPVKEG